MRPVCPRCSGWVERVAYSWRAPEHDRCLMCGWYNPRPEVIAMPEIPPLDYTRREMPPEIREKKRVQNRASRERRRSVYEARRKAQARGGQ